MNFSINIRFRYTTQCVCGLIIYLLAPGIAQAQHVYNNGTNITINGNSKLYVRGAYYHQAGQIDNAGEIYITDSLVNNFSTFGIFGDATNHPSAGKVIFNGSGNQQVSGTGLPIFFYDFELANTSSNAFILFTPINVAHALSLSSGNINLNTRVIDLDFNGSLLGEANTKRIFGTAGYIRAFRNLVGFNGEIAGFGLHLDATANNFGLTEIRRSHYQLTPFSTNGHINRFYDFRPTNPGVDVVNTLAIDFFSNETLPAHNLSDYRIFHSYQDGFSWVKETSVAGDQPEFDFQAMAINVSYFGGKSPALKKSLVTIAEGTCLNPPVVDLGASTQNLCEGSSLELSGTAGQQTYIWSKDGTVIPSATTRKLTVTEGGVYQLKVIDANGCEGADAVTVEIKQKPVADFSVLNFACQGNATNFSDLSSSVDGSFTHAWDLGDPANTSDLSTDPSPSYVYTNAGSFVASLTVTSSFGCVSDVRTKSAVVNALPVANFSADQVCFGNTTTFVNQSSAGTNLLWDFGGGNTSTLPSPQVSLPLTGSNSVTLLATDANTSCARSVTKDVMVKPKPIADFDLVPDCKPNKIRFTNSSVISSGSLTYSWIFGDGETGGTEDFLKIYQQAGTYDVTMQVSSNLGCVETVTKQASVALPEPVFSGDVVTCGNEITLNANESGRFTGGSFTWSDGSMAESLTLTQSGTYSVTIAMPDGCNTTGSVKVTLNSVAVPDLGTSVEACDTYTIDAGFYPSGTYTWSTGSTSQRITVDQSAVYSVEVVDQNGCVGAASVNVQINPLPVVDLGPEQVLCNGKTTVLDAGTSGDTYEWSDGSTNQFLTAGATGTYEVKVTNEFGCSFSDAVMVTVLSPLNVDLGPDKVICAGNPVTLDAGITNVDYAWGSSVGSQGTNRTLTANRGGNYWVSINDLNGCTASDSILVSETNNTLEVNFLSTSEVMPGDTLQFVNVSYPRPFDSFWDFGNGQTSKAEDAQVTYFTEGTFDVTLTVTNGICTNVKTKPISVSNSAGRVDPGSSSKDAIVSARAYPNPTDKNIRLQVELSERMKVGITLVNLVGVSFLKQVSDIQFFDEELDLTRLNPGVYFIRIVTASQSKTIRILKQ